MVKGFVKSFNTKRGYGFITIKEDYRDVLVHYSTIRADNFKNLKKGQTVFLDYAENNKKLVAKLVVALKCSNKNK